MLESANLAIESMNGFQIGSKRLKVQHKRTGQGSSEHSEDLGGPAAPGPYYERVSRDSDGMLEVGSEMRRADPNASAGSYPFRGAAQSRYAPDLKESHHPQQQQQQQQQQQHYPYSVYPSPYPQYNSVDVLAMNRRGGGRTAEQPHGMVGQGQGPPPGMMLASPAQRPGPNVSFHSMPMSMSAYNYSPSPVQSAGYGARAAGAGYLDGPGFSPSPGPHPGDEYSLRQNSGGRGRRGGGDREGLGQGGQGARRQEVGRMDPRRGFNEFPDQRDGPHAPPDGMMVAQQYQPQGLSYHQPPPQQQLYQPQQQYPYRGGSGPNQRTGKAMPLFGDPHV